TAFSVRMVMADGAVYVRASGEALVYLGGRAIDRSREGSLAPDAELALIDEAVAACGDEASVPRAEEGWECVGEGMIGAYVDRCASHIASLEASGARPVSVSVDEASGLLATLLARLGVPIAEEDTGLSLVVSTDGRTLSASLPDEQVQSVLADAITTSPAAPAGTGLYCVDPAFVLDADALCAGAALAVLGA
ncbi:phosphomannomutase, partial [Schaalia odontolytica]